MIGLYTLWHDDTAVATRAAAFAAGLRNGASPPPTTVLRGAILCDNATAGRHDIAMAPDGTAVLFTGTIDNSRALRRELRVEDRRLSTLYAAAYGCWGDEADRHLFGDYAAILLASSGRQVRLVRSPIQAPALYVWRDSERLIVANTPAAIFATGEIAREIDDQKLADSLLLNYAEEGRGWFRGVTRLPRATRVWITPDGSQERVFYRVEDIAPIRLKSDAEYVEAADALFREAVTSVLDDYERPAVSLSGGFDSQAVAAYAMRTRPGLPLDGFTSVPVADWTPTQESIFGDERPRVEALADMYPQLRPHWVDTADKGLSYLQREIFEQALLPPRNGANLHWIHDLRRQAKDAGADVLLTGALGNLTFSYDGTAAIPGFLRQGRLGLLMRELWHGGPVGALHKRTIRQAILPLLPADMQLAMTRRQAGDRDRPLESWSPIHPDFARSFRVEDRYAEMNLIPMGLPPASVAEFRRLLLNNAINEAGDLSPAMDRLHGIPTRDPTAYRPLLEFCFAIPNEQYIHKGTKRWLARRMLRGKVPDMVLDETRRGRQTADWFTRMSGRKPALLDEIDWLEGDRAVAARLDLARLRQAVEAMPDDPQDMTRAQSKTLAFALPRALTTARFIRYIAGRNDI